jgi:coenzyme F420-reducing hydrogenase beta subunit
MKSTSGGVFSAVAELVLEKSNSYVYGAQYDHTWRVCHKGTDSKNGLDALRQSKYIQSYLGNTYSAIREVLNRDGQVLFCGTPCQVDGLRLYLGKDYEKLLLLEFICHGVTSPEIFKAYIQSIEKQYGSRVKTFRFRDKVTIGNLLSLGHTTITFENGKKRSSECNLYLRAYMAGLMQRVSCEKCPYATSQRRADITVGDFWGLEDILPELKNESQKGISLILCNTPKGLAICENLSEKMHLVPTKLTHAFNGINKQIERPVQANKNKQRLYSDVDKIGVRLVLARAIGLQNLIMIYYGWCINRVKAYLPSKVYGALVFLKRAIRR